VSADRRYWDSDVFLGWLMNDPEKAPSCQGVLAQAEAGRVQIVTSALTLTEVIRLKGHARLPRESEDKIRDFFEHDWIVVRDVDRFIAEEARELVWSRNVQPKDSIHLATALSLKLSEFDTFDRDLHKLNGKLGNPPLTIASPNVPYQSEIEGLEARPPRKKR
jgi:predicted nucleic acid-binding protein